MILSGGKRNRHETPVSFFRAGPLEAPPIAPFAGLTCTEWKPSVFSIWPRGVERRRLHWCFRWLMHYGAVFHSNEYCALIVKDGERIVHHSIVCPGWFRIPCCGDGDLVIGPTWTEASYRQRGIGSWVLMEIRHRLRRPARRFLYIAGNINQPSHRAALRAGFHLFAVGKQVVRLGLKALGRCLITDEASQVPHAVAISGASGTLIQKFPSKGAGAAFAPLPSKRGGTKRSR